MSRYIDHSDDDSPDMVLARGRWQRNARAVLKSRRGRKALAEIREALLALPEKRLIEGALCTVGGPDRVSEVTEAEIDAHVARLREAGGGTRGTTAARGRRRSCAWTAKKSALPSRRAPGPGGRAAVSA
jgi:hypothetical protein